MRGTALEYAGAPTRDPGDADALAEIYLAAYDGLSILATLHQSEAVYAQVPESAVLGGSGTALGKRGIPQAVPDPPFPRQRDPCSGPRRITRDPSPMDEGDRA